MPETPDHYNTVNPYPEEDSVTEPDDDFMTDPKLLTEETGQAILLQLTLQTQLLTEFANAVSQLSSLADGLVGPDGKPDLKSVLPKGPMAKILGSLL